MKSLDKEERGGFCYAIIFISENVQSLSAIRGPRIYQGFNIRSFGE